MQKYRILTPARLLFPLALVLFEFSVYIANDMIQPGMLAVVREFGADVSWVPSAMTGFLLGGALLPWLVGPWSDRMGRRPVLLVGVAFFIACCLMTLAVHDIRSFIALRVLQGIGLSFISAVGYAAIQEAFAERAAIKVTALMANVSLIAPMIGPLLGALLVQFWPWRASFLLIAVLAAVSFAGLWWSMPETVDKSATRPLRLSALVGDYRTLFANRRFVASALCIPLLALPLMGWVALSPLLLVTGGGMSVLDYGVSQLPVFGALIAGNMLLVRLTDRWPLGRSVGVGRYIAFAGVLLLAGGAWGLSRPQLALIAGMSLIAFGEGLAFAVLYRFALTASRVANGATAAGMTLLSMPVYVLGIEALKQVYLTAGVAGYAMMVLVYMLVFSWLSSRMVSVAMAERAPRGRLAPESA